MSPSAPSEDLDKRLTILTNETESNGIENTSQMSPIPQENKRENGRAARKFQTRGLTVTFDEVSYPATKMLLCVLFASLDASTR